MDNLLNRLKALMLCFDSKSQEDISIHEEIEDIYNRLNSLKVNEMELQPTYTMKYIKLDDIENTFKD